LSIRKELPSQDELDEFYRPPPEYYENQKEIEYQNDEEIKGAELVKELEDGIRVVQYHGATFLQGGRFSLNIMDQLFEKINQNKACVILVTGEAGSSKSWTALALAQIVDHSFSPELQIVWSRSQFLELISDESPLKPKQVIIVDESAYIAGSRRWYEDAQKLLMEQLTSVRFKQLVIIFIAINAELLDNLIRNNLVTFRITVESRGISSVYKTTHNKFMPNKFPKKLGKLYLKIPDYDKCKSPTCLQCQFSGLLKPDWNKRDRWVEDGFRLCQVNRVRMERIKRLRVEEANVSAREKLQDARAKRLTDVEICDNLIPFIAEIERKPSGEMNVDSLASVCLDRLHTQLSKQRSYTIRSKLAQKLEKVGGIA